MHLRDFNFFRKGKKALFALLKYIAFAFYKLFDQVIHPLIHAPIHKKLIAYPPKTQIFVLARHDYGALVCDLHYAALWRRERGKIAIVVLTKRLQFTLSLIKIICPDVDVITYNNSAYKLFRFLFKKDSFRAITFQYIYSLVRLEKISAICLWDVQPFQLSSRFVGEYIDHFDPFLKFAKEKSEMFLDAYLHFRRHYFIRYQYWTDFNHMLISREPLANTLTFQKKGEIFKKLKLSSPYVILHLSAALSGKIVADRRRIQHPMRFNCIIDKLIEGGYHVVLQGRSEQPSFSPRKGFVDYAHSDYCSPENDLALFIGAEFAISSKTGPDVFCQLCQIPLLGINYNEPAITSAYHQKYRFFYKHIITPEGKCLNWKEVLNHPIFFEYGVDAYSFSPDFKSYQFEEMSKEELIDTLEEFLRLVSQPDDKWLEYSEEQKAFRAALDPSHFDLYACQGVPCNTYLCSEKSERYISATLSSALSI